MKRAEKVDRGAVLLCCRAVTARRLLTLICDLSLVHGSFAGLCQVSARSLRPLRAGRPAGDLLLEPEDPTRGAFNNGSSKEAERLRALRGTNHHTQWSVESGGDRLHHGAKREPLGRRNQCNAHLQRSALDLLLKQCCAPKY